MTQLFFDNDYFFRFRDDARRAGVTIPIIAGLMPVTSTAQFDRFKSLSGCTMPDRLVEFLRVDSSEEVVQRGIEYGLAQSEELLHGGVDGIHLYTLNKSHSSAAIIAGLRENGRLSL